MSTGMTIDTYLSNYSKNHATDKTFKKWYAEKFGVQYAEKDLEEWDRMIDSFFSEPATAIKTGEEKKPVLSEPIDKEEPKSVKKKFLEKE